MPFPRPTPAQVIRYAYLWRKDALRGAEEGSKDRPCAVILTVQDESGDDVVTVLPITHTPPYRTADALEIPAETKRRLGLDDARSWVALTEANRFHWPGPDIRITRQGNMASVVYGYLPARFFEKVRLAFLENIRATQGAAVVQRTE